MKTLQVSCPRCGCDQATKTPILDCVACRASFRVMSRGTRPILTDPSAMTRQRPRPTPKRPAVPGGAPFIASGTSNVLGAWTNSGQLQFTLAGSKSSVALARGTVTFVSKSNPANQIGATISGIFYLNNGVYSLQTRSIAERPVEGGVVPFQLMQVGNVAGLTGRGIVVFR